MTESTVVETINKNEKNMVAGCIYKHCQQTIADFLNNHFLPLLEKLSRENKLCNSTNGRFQHTS